MSNAVEVINFYNSHRDKHAAPHLDWEEFDALAESHAELLGALECIAVDPLSLNCMSEEMLRGWAMAAARISADAIAKAKWESQ